VYERLWNDYCEREASVERLEAQAAEAYRTQKPQAAVELFGAALKLAPRASGYSNLGAALRAGGRFEEAEAAYRQAIARDPGLVSAHSNLGNLLSNRGRMKEAEVALRRAFELSPGDAQIGRNLGVSVLAQGRLREAETILRQALSLAPQDGDIQ